jgi:hypothetical protein
LLEPTSPSVSDRSAMEIKLEGTRLALTGRGRRLT